MMLLRKYALLWSTMGALGNSRLVQSSYLWILVVPPAAHALTAVGPDVRLTVAGAEIVFTLGLPFSWKVFYISAVFLGIATLAFRVWCPEIVRRFDSFARFVGDGRGPGQIIGYMQLLLRTATRHEQVGLVETFVGNFCRATGPRKWRPAADDPAIGLALSEIVEGREAEAFWFTYEQSDRSRVYVRASCTTLFGCGMALVAVVLVQNFFFVINVLLR